jgi:hypothetical protein
MLNKSRKHGKIYINKFINKLKKNQFILSFLIKILRFESIL